MRIGINENGSSDGKRLFGKNEESAKGGSLFQRWK